MKTKRNNALTRKILLGMSIKDAAKEAGISHGCMCQIFYRTANEMGIYPKDTTRFLSQARKMIQEDMSLMKTKHDLELEGICYVLLRVGKAHPITDRRFDLIWYPETGLPLLDCVQYRPYFKSVVTENPWIIACYKQENVRIWDGERGWIMPDFQTYGASVNKITMSLLGIRQTMPSTPYDGGKAIRKLIDETLASRP